MNNKILGIVFFALLIIFAISKLFKGDVDNSFDKNFVIIDTSQIDKILIHPKSDGVSYVINRMDNGWRVIQGDLNAKANESTVQSTLRTLSKIEIKRLVSKSKEKWLDYEVDESNGVRLEIFSGSKKLEDFVVGRFNFNQQTRSATSYVRKYGEDDIYSLDGFLSMTLNQGFDGIRDKTLLDMDKNNIASITIQDAMGQSILSKNNGVWTNQNGISVDSAGMQQYLNVVSRLTGQTLIDNQDVSQLNSIGTIKYTTNDQSESTLNVFSRGDDFIITSSYNIESVFSSDSTGIYKRAWEDLVELMTVSN